MKKIVVLFIGLLVSTIVPAQHRNQFPDTAKKFIRKDSTDYRKYPPTKQDSAIINKMDDREPMRREEDSLPPKDERN